MTAVNCIAFMLLSGCTCGGMNKAIQSNQPVIKGKMDYVQCAYIIITRQLAYEWKNFITHNNLSFHCYLFKPMKSCVNNT
jgi:hypothetical protein